jgi:hypothetical protein
MTKNANKAAAAALIIAAGSNSETIVSAAPKSPAAEVIAAVVPPTKADKARVIFAECYAMATVPARGDMIKRAVAEAGLTSKGAATYLQNYKNKQGLSVRKAPTAVAA